MNNAFDIIILILLVYYFWRGWRKGFLRSILGPISLIIGGIMSYVYYQNNPEKILIALGISIVGPVIFVVTLSLLMKIWTKATSEDGKMSVLNRLMGSAFSIIWSGGMLLLVFMLIMLVPGHMPYIGKVHQYLYGTQTYAVISHFTGNTLARGESGTSPMIQFLENPEKFEYLSNTKEFKNVMGHNKIKEIPSDPDIVQDIQDKNVGKLLTSPKMQSIMGDKDLIKNFFSLQKKIMEESLEDLEIDNVPIPKVIEIPEPQTGI